MSGNREDGLLNFPRLIKYLAANLIMVSQRHGLPHSIRRASLCDEDAISVCIKLRFWIKCRGTIGALSIRTVLFIRGARD